MKQPAAGTPRAGGLQFERAEPTGSSPGLTCASCSKAITMTYFEVNGNVVCQRCRSQIVSAWNRGSSAGRFARALGLGLVAATAGAGLYFGIAALTGYEFGLVAIVVGLLVGGAVRKGSNGRGGWRYQALAMFLTYTAVVVTDSSLIARELSKDWEAPADSLQAADADASMTGMAAGVSASADGDATAGNADGVGLLAVGLGFAALVVLAYAAPIMIGIASPIHLLIAAFALYEAWKLNRGVALSVSGPYQASTAAA